MKKIYFFSIIAIALLILGLYLSSRDYVVTIPEKTIREKLNERLPLTKTYLFIFDLTLDNPRIALDPKSNRIATGLDLALNIGLNDKSKPLNGSLDVSGSIRYVSEEGAFYLSDPLIENLSIDGLPKKHKSKASAAIEKALVNFYSTRPVYKLKSTDLKQATAKTILKSLVVQESNIVVTLGL